VRNQPPPAGGRLEKWKDRFAAYDNDRGWKVVEVLRALATENQTTPSAIALAWLLAKPAVTSVIFGARSIEQLDENLAAADVKLTAAEFAKLDEASAVDFGYPYKFIANIQQRW
jgi:aryl-alcohol dehydrogenase-like predicted oxidoreductase